MRYICTTGSVIEPISCWKTCRPFSAVEHLRDGAGEFEVLAHERVDPRMVGIVFVDVQIRQRPERHFEVRIVALFGQHAHALNALHDDVRAAVAPLDALDRDQRADVVHARAVGRILLSIPLSHRQQLLAVLGSGLHGGERLRPADCERHDQFREHHGVLQRKDWKRLNRIGHV